MSAEARRRAEAAAETSARAMRWARCIGACVVKRQVTSAASAAQPDLHSEHAPCCS